MKILYWLSFSDESGFLGALVLEVPEGFDPVMHAHALHLNPGGEVVFSPVPPEHEKDFPAEFRNRLLNETDCVALGAEKVEL